MLKLRFNIVRDWDAPFSERSLLDDLIKGIGIFLPEGVVVDSALKYGFEIRIGKPSTLKEYIFPSTTLEKQSNPKQLARLKSAIG